MTINKSQLSRVMRVSGQNYTRFTKSKDRYARRHKLKRCTYDQFFEQLMNVADALLSGEEIYIIGGRAFDDLAEARGESIRLGVKHQQTPEWPAICVRLGHDKGPA